MSYEDEVVDYDAFAYGKKAGEYPFDQLPVLEVDGRRIAQTGSILR
jgi:glutathione S-transferase